MPEPALTLWALPASHPVMTVQRALELKGVPFERIDLLPVMSHAVLRARFRAGTVPAVRFANGERVQGSREILDALEDRWPDVPLLPDDTAVQRAAEWGEQVLQPIVRRLAWWCLGEQPAAMPTYTAGIRTVPPSPAFVTRAFAPAIAKAARRLNHVDEPAIRADLTHLPAHLDRVDAWITAGALDGAHLNAADLHIGASLRLALTFGDLAPLIEGRPGATLARRVFSDWTGATPSGAIPPSWLPAASA
jgi:glutathione S-transferase